MTAKASDWARLSGLAGARLTQRALRTGGLALLVGCGIELPSNVYRCDDGRCPSPLMCSPQRYCVDKSALGPADAGTLDAASESSPASPDASAEASVAIPPLGRGDASDLSADARAHDSDAASGTHPGAHGSDGATPALDDGGPGPSVDAGSGDASAPSADTGPSEVPDAGQQTVVVDSGIPVVDSGIPVVVDAGTPTPTNCVAWATTTVTGDVPAGAKLLATEQNDLTPPKDAPTGALPPYVHQQYVCSRDRIIPGKYVPDFGCNVVVKSGGEWVLTFVPDETETTFSVLAPPAGCVLDFLPLDAKGELPARRLEFGREPDGTPTFACKAFYEKEDRKGHHLGRVDANVFPYECRYEWYGVLRQTTLFEVLVQMSP